MVGLILGPIAEENLRRALAISQGDAGALVDSWFSIVALTLAVLAVVVPALLRAVRRPQAEVDREDSGQLEPSKPVQPS